MKEFFKNRVNIIGLFGAVLVTVLLLRAVNLQVVNGKYYSAISSSRGYSSKTLDAPRGEIADKYGRIIATNKTIETVFIEDVGLNDEELNNALSELILLAERIEKPYSDSLPITLAKPYEFTFESAEAEQKWKDNFKFDKDETAAQVFDFLKDKYEIKDDFGEALVRKIMGLRFDMKRSNFSKSTPFEFVRDVDINVISELKENRRKYPCISVDVVPVRDYPLGNTASHMMGYIGLINEEEYSELKGKGYGMQDYVGKTGLEKYLESDLKGVDGKTGITIDVNGQTTVVNEDVPAVPGNRVMLTIDIDMQTAAESALAEAIARIREKEGANFIGGGAAVAVDVNSGAVLAFASCPDYNPATFSKDYNALIEDKNKPLYNRATVGTYSPGSTFKPLVALAGLNEGVISAHEHIECTGQYQYYAPDYTPSCWIYGYYGRNHGELDVVGALENSCNIFFFETGRRLKIKKINEYAKMFGFGKETGIEIGGESAGVVAGPEEREASGGDWYPADTIQAAIGQSDNKFTILQLANYCAALANKGTLYKPYLVDTVISGETGHKIKKSAPQIVRKIDIDDKYWDIVHAGMLAVTTEGSTASVFEDAPYRVGGKTGTAQTSSSKNDSLFIAYAPYDNPKIAVACIIENGGILGEGNQVVGVARKILDSYLVSDNETAESNAVEYNKILR